MHILAFLIALTFLSSPVYAYIDPFSLSILGQAILGFFGAVAIFGYKVKHKIINFFKPKRQKDNNDEKIEQLKENI